MSSEERPSTARGVALVWVLVAVAVAVAAGAVGWSLLRTECVILAPCLPCSPHHDRDGMVCADDGLPTEAYCTTLDGVMQCARDAGGGKCPSSGNKPAEKIPRASESPAAPGRRGQPGAGKTTGPTTAPGIKLPALKKYRPPEPHP